MAEKLFPEGAYVSNPRMPDWGIGKVLELRDGGNVRVFFENAGERIMPPANMSPASGQGDHPLLNEIGSTTKLTKVKATHAKPKKPK
jgi:hypothetical protein